MHYAALDAFVLPQLYDRLCTELGEQRSQQLLKQHTTSVRRVSAADGQQQQQQQDKPHKRHAEVAGNADQSGDAAAAATPGDRICNPSKRQELAPVQDTESK
jgi:ribonuclease D